MKHKIISILSVISLLILFLLGCYGWMLFVVFIWLALTVWGVFDIRLGYFMPVLYQKKTHKKEIAVTFDDGPTEFTTKILDLLEKHHAKATFFCIGKQIEIHPEIFSRIYHEGHQIGNHSYSHSNSFGFFSAKKVKEELHRTNLLIKKYTDKENLDFRPPFGVTNPHIAMSVRQLGLRVIGWNIRSLDTVITDENKILKRISTKVKPGSILLLHDTSEKTIRVLEQLLITLQKENYQLVTINKLLENE